MFFFLDGILKTPTPSASGTIDQLPSQECLISHLSVSSQSSCESCHAASASNTPQSPPVAVSASNTPQTSPVTEFLAYPTPIRKTRLKASNKCARVLTSAESRRLLREKEQKKKDEEEEKARRKREREEKRVTREEEKKRKLAEREAKKEAIAKKKAKKQKKTKGNNNPVAFVVPSSSVNRKLPGEFSGSGKTYPKRKRMLETNRESDEDACSVCFGLYKDDIQTYEWIQCSNEDCSVWSHVYCLDETDSGYICAVCDNVFM